MNKKKNSNTPLIVTTAHKGVFFGYGTPSDAKTIRLSKARMCIHWTAECRGVLGLAASGPKPGCRITPQVPAITLTDVTSVVEASAEAAEAWEKGIWN